MPIRKDKPFKTTSTRQRGVAMILVLIVVASASLMGWAVLASTSVGSQVASASQTNLQRKYLAESGIELAIYYLQHPSASPVGLTKSDWGNLHYPGETGIRLPPMPGTIDVKVISIANGTYQVVSTGTLNGISQTITAEVVLKKKKTFTHAANFFDDVKLASNVTITGGVMALGSVITNSASVVGEILSGSTDDSLADGSASDFRVSVTNFLPDYYVDGKRYKAKKISSSIVMGSLMDTDVVNNPYNVWYTDQNVTFLLTTVVNGTIITKKADLTIDGNLTVNSRTNLPAVVTDGDLIIKGSFRTVLLNGPTYVTKKIKGKGITTGSKLVVNGAFITPTKNSLLESFNGKVNLTYDASKATISGMIDAIEEVSEIKIRSWVVQ